MTAPAMMPGKLACMRLRSGRHMKPGREKRIYKRAQRARERAEALSDVMPREPLGASPGPTTTLAES